MFIRDEDGTPEDAVTNLGKKTMQNDEGSATNVAWASEIAEDLLGRVTYDGQPELEGGCESDVKEESGGD